MPSAEAPEVRVQGARVPEADGLAEEIGVGLRERDHLVLDGEGDDVAFGARRDVPRRRSARAAMIFCILTCGRTGSTGAPLGGGRARVSRAATARDRCGARVDGRALASTSAPSLLALPRIPRKSERYWGQAAQEPVLPPSDPRCGSGRVRLAVATTRGRPQRLDTGAATCT